MGEHAYPPVLIFPRNALHPCKGDVLCGIYIRRFFAVKLVYIIADFLSSRLIISDKQHRDAPVPIQRLAYEHSQLGLMNGRKTRYRKRRISSGKGLTNIFYIALFFKDRAYFPEKRVLSVHSDTSAPLFRAANFL